MTASELATAQSFVMELCELLDVPKPHSTPAQGYMFERPVTFSHGDGSSSAGRVDCSHQSNQLDLKGGSDNLGHANVSTTNTYLHAEDDTRHDATSQAHKAGWSGR